MRLISVAVVCVALAGLALLVQISGCAEGSPVQAEKNGLRWRPIGLIGLWPLGASIILPCVPGNSLRSSITPESTCGIF
jgi:hypothetical protein